MNEILRVLILEDSFADAELIQRELRKAGFSFTVFRAEDKSAFLAALETFAPDLILVDYALPGFDGMAALTLARRRFGDIPVILVSGAIGEETAIETLKAGATDYVLKQRLQRLGPVIRRALLEAGQLAGRKRAEQERETAHEAMRHLNTTLEQKVAERTELAEARAKQLHSLAMELIEAEERERRRIAELLHDDLQQVLASARMQLQAACESLPRVPMLENVGQLLEESIAKSRRLAHELSPAMLQHSGLTTVLEWLARQMNEKFGLHVRLEDEAVQQFENPSLKLFLFRAVQEFLFNVVKHAGVKTARVALSGSESGLVVTVSDRGRGFDPDILESPTANAGWGLLSLRERARYMGGNLVIESAPGKGSRFILTVPSLVESGGPKGPGRQRQPMVSVGVNDSAGAGGIRVLFADDHQVMREGLITLIAGQPDIHVAGEAANGLEAVELARQLKPDVVLMDVSMPEMDGIEATRRIKAELPRVCVIGLSMHEDKHIAGKMLHAGAEAFLSKAASKGELLKAIYGTTCRLEDRRSRAFPSKKIS